MQVDELYQLLTELGIRKLQSPKNGNIMGCCPFHADNNPSFGVSTSEPHLANCFYCGGMRLEKVVAHCLGFYTQLPKGEVKYDYKRAKDWLREKFNVSFKQVGKAYKRAIPRYGEKLQGDAFDDRQGSHVCYPEYRIAKFNSGKTTHESFFSRGFTESTARSFSIGFDSECSRITIPIRWSDGSLAGVVGRRTKSQEVLYVTKEKVLFTKGKKPIRIKFRKIVPNPKYFNYWNFDKSKVLFPIHKFNYQGGRKTKSPIRGRNKRVIIACEGPFDVMWLHQIGYTNSLCFLGSKPSDAQIALLESLQPDIVIDMFDNDEAGRRGGELLIRRAKTKFLIYRVQYPEGKHDPGECTEKEIHEMVKNARIYLKKAIDRLV